MEEVQEEQPLGKKAQKWNDLNTRMVNAALYSLSHEFKQSFGPIVNNYTQELESSHEQFLMFCNRNLWKQFELITTDNQLIDKLNKLEKAGRLPHENPSTKNEPRLVPEPNQIIRSLRVKLKMEAIAKLREDGEKLRAENEQLMSEIAAKTEALEKKKADVNTTLKQYHETVEVAKSIPVEELEAVVDQIS